ncbi:hypothetical protein FA077_26700, partial [Pseudomonas aeruginosa]|nr:hypothetical protein [Pseudomonas aeruginosa]
RDLHEPYRRQRQMCIRDRDSYNKRLQATHYTIMPAKPMYREVLMGQLDNFVRNAIRRQWEKARGL